MTKDKLRQIITLDKIIESKLRQLEDLKTTLYGLKSTVEDVTGIRGTSVPNPTESAAIQIVTLSEEINATIDQLVDLKDEVLKYIKQLDTKYQLVMELRYMECLNWTDVATISGYSAQHVYRLHGEALKILKDESK